MITVDDFNTPKDRPWGMLRGYDRAAEKENILTLVLTECLNAGAFVAVKTKYNHPSMVEDGLLQETDGGYVLTTKAVGLLYSVYGRGFDAK